MKATDYMDKFNRDFEDEEEIFRFAMDCVLEMIKEIPKIAATRKAQTEDAWKAVVKEIEAKANKFIKLVNKKYGRIIKADNFFKKYLKIVLPELYDCVYAKID